MKRDRIRRYLLRPLDRRTTLTANQEAVTAALERLDDRSLGAAALSIIAKRAKSSRKDGDKSFYRDPAHIQDQVLLSKALYLCRRISRAQFVFFASAPIETLNEERCSEGSFDRELDEIRKQIRILDRASGLPPNRYWPKGQAPAAFQGRYDLLESNYSEAIEGHFVEALREFGLDDLADLHENNSKEFDRLRERGRRSLFHKGEHIPVLKDTVVRHEEEALRAAAVKAYTAGVILLGAALEGLLLIRCLRSPQKAKRIALALPKKQRPLLLDDPTKWAFDTLIKVCLAAGWLPCISTEYGKYAPAALADTLRNMRNLVHPGRCVRERPWSETDERDFKDAEAIYLTLRSKLLGRRSLTDTAP